MEHVDLIVIGSGPNGAAVAREYAERVPEARILMIERGPKTTPVPGESVRNLEQGLRERAEARAQGPLAGRAHSDITPRAGTFLLTDATGPDQQTGMPGALASAGVGGMGQHWTCACPTPGNTERIPFIDEAEFEDLLARAWELLAVSQEAYPAGAVRSAVERELGSFFDEGRPASRRVQAMPLAATSRPGGRPFWSGTSVVLGPLLELHAAERFEIRDMTVARRVLLGADGAVRGVEVEDRATGERYEIEAPLVTVAADSFGSPQLLWASGIRPRALGHYLNDQPQIMCSVYLSPSILEQSEVDAVLADPSSDREALTGVSWIPFHAPDYPFHGQIMQRDATPIPLEDGRPGDPRPVVGLGCFTTKEIRFEDFVEFDDDRLDPFGMPAPIIHYELTPTDRQTLDRALGIIRRLIDHMGTPVAEPRHIPAGSSLHYQGSVRMGAVDDGTSVCDPTGAVWGVPGLYVAGNGVIPTATASNPTVFSVALSIRAARAMARLRTGAAV